MLNTINPQGIANENHSKLKPYTCQNGCYQSQKITSVGEYWRKGNPCELLVEMEISAATVETAWRFLKKLNIEIPFDPPKSTDIISEYISKDNKITIICKKRYLHPYVHSSSIHNSWDMETTYMSVHRWMDKENL